MREAQGLTVNARETLFHLENAHHQTDLLMSVIDISASRANTDGSRLGNTPPCHRQIFEAAYQQ
ncbi:DUF4431 domain-containing protein [Xanthomonas vasicola]|uniref:DUF4431 domain-containing protein n=1 Tax=Xanthomonas vasicola TaxID=56459 RepID=A0ABD7S9Q9_XANVA|nr:DUF4431 domain-containing protein [Xanthomonas vasicola]AZR32789.1 DUF4431 domain-containing protein [Xanthomonas vasicola pv. musacearum NCPPB 4379]MBV6741684.1 DUF4431 domain-containing protein [Xanthomonas vasicola pv. musacearum NCPPB 2251]MBV6744692.1 DUF4431 domain-containing protein [Xanthomonas vasicola pv. vasculorum NCPPB 890]MBV6890305.1 DUF4431 domain-containing protein [Xanthomonas vasicola pv. vasculorum]MBV7277536.1 DUF4431 domain-containing protein [Xanthomonas vasicola pv. 